MADGQVLHYQILASLGEFGDWDDVSGADLNINNTDYTEAGKKYPKKIPGTHSYSDATLMRAYVPARDASVIEWGERYKLGLDTSRVLTWRVQNPQGMVIDVRTYLCHPITIKKPDGKAGDNTVGQISLTLAIEAQN